MAYARTLTSSDNGPALRRMVQACAVAILLLVAFGASFLLIRHAPAPEFNNRAQSQIRSPMEEAQANAGWNPNKTLSGNQKYPEPNTWAANFGKALADVTGVDADAHLYPPGMAPAGGGVPTEYQGQEEIISDSSSSNIPHLPMSEERSSSNNASNSTSTGGSAVGSVSNSQPAASNDADSTHSPVSRLFNR